MTQGLKFGATFLAYEGDPLTCHAKYLVQVSKSSQIDMQTLIQCERLANSVAKDLLIAYLSESGDSSGGESPQIEYATISFNKSQSK